VDPVEKKPLYHFLPGTPILSIATVGCNLHCRNCQNWEISQGNPEEEEAYRLDPGQVVAAAEREGCRSLAYTYTDPVVWYEYALATSELARERGLRNVLVTAAYVNPDPFRRLLAVTDAANIDLKFVDDRLYREVCGATLAPVQAALVMAKEAGVWLEVTNLVIPTLNDGPRDIARLCRWHADHLGPDTPLHFSRFVPRYRMKNLPPTPAESLEAARRIALDEGLRFVYIGNVPGTQGEWTFCPSCGEAVIRRVGYEVETSRLADGACRGCGLAIPGVWR
jgi:pyruvate formate lyase activating enzyme